MAAEARPHCLSQLALHNKRILPGTDTAALQDSGPGRRSRGTWPGARGGGGAARRCRRRRRPWPRCWPGSGTGRAWSRTPSPSTACVRLGARTGALPRRASCGALCRRWRAARRPQALPVRGWRGPHVHTVLRAQWGGPQGRRMRPAALRPHVKELKSKTWPTPAREPAAQPGERVQLCARRVVPGHWLGPSTLCHTLEALCRQRRPGGLRVRVVATAGGGAPVLATSECGPRPSRSAFSRPYRMHFARPRHSAAALALVSPAVARPAHVVARLMHVATRKMALLSPAMRRPREQPTEYLPPRVPASTWLVHWSPAPQHASICRVEAEFEAAPAAAASDALPPAAPAGAPAAAAASPRADAGAADAAGRGAPGGAPAAGGAAADAPGLLLLVPLMLGLHGKVRRRSASAAVPAPRLCISRGHAARAETHWAARHARAAAAAASCSPQRSTMVKEGHADRSLPPAALSSTAELT